MTRLLFGVPKSIYEFTRAGDLNKIEGCYLWKGGRCSYKESCWALWSQVKWKVVEPGDHRLHNSLQPPSPHLLT